MSCLIFLSMVLSCLNIYIFVKWHRFPKSSQKEFEKHAEKLIVEFNRVCTRNISILEESLSELHRKIQIANKIKNSLPEDLDIVIKSDMPSEISKEEEEINTKEKRDIGDALQNSRFEGFSVEQIRQRKNQVFPESLQKDIIKYYAEAGEISTDMLAHYGLSQNEINLILLGANKSQKDTTSSSPK